MSIDYNNIVELVNILHKFVYDKDNTDQYMYTILKPEKINMNSIIKDNSFEYQFILNSSLEKKDNFKIMTIIDNNSENFFVSNSKTQNKKLVLKKYFKNHPITLVIQKHYSKYEETLNMIDIYFELFMNQLISEYIINDKIPFYLLNICNFNIDLDKLRASKDFFDLVVEQFKLYDTNNKDKFCISLYEHYHSYDTLSNLLKTELAENDIKSILFQTLFAYAYLNYKLTNFRHNYFCIDSFLVQKESKETTYYLRLGDLSFKLVNPKFICKLFNYRFSSIDGFKNIYETDLSNSTYDIYFFFRSLLDFKEIHKKNLEKIKIIISNFISYDLINSPLIDEIKFKTKYTFSIIPIHILSKNNFFVNFINMNSKSKEFNKKYSKKEEFDTLDEWGLDDGLTKKTSKKKTSKKKGSLKKVKAADRKVSRYMTQVSPDKENQTDNLIEGDSDNYKTPVDTGYKKKSKSKSKSKTKSKTKSKNKVEEESSISSLSFGEGGSFGDGGLFAQKASKSHNAPIVKNKKNEMSRFLKNIGTEQLIPVIGEVQNTMDINQYQNNQVYSSDNGEAKIMDKGIYSLINSGKLQMPYVNSAMQMPQQQDPYSMMGQDPYSMMGQDPYQAMGQDPYSMMGQQMMSPQMSQFMPGMPPGMQNMPGMPGMQPGMAGMPGMPGMAGMADMPGMPGMEGGINKLPMPMVDLNKNNLLSDSAPLSLNTNVDNLVGGSILDFFLKKKK